ncbi:hypothetical protein [Arthrobacter sp. CAN_C5]|uniref:hypothetical protein n=1 Tax=Arthrobacter sp. CAN_C5 TaxID=2760706 RepID=UPI001AE88327|nr:hypothetical protein [Arthrobacter sp. CAN_C5]MBP2216000.1 hypothetical protein [Arthrobacter sp. CAN_C5]
MNDDHYVPGKAMASASVAWVLMDTAANPETLRLHGLDLAIGVHAYQVSDILKNTY